ncbi:MAG TPA: ATP-binding cassette domain-containing protein [Ktedonobacteraceae bacterium]|nr:ATP-binding cassette domain-containing protein [Ktedonobacteraceae bacterium]
MNGVGKSTLLRILPGRLSLGQQHKLEIARLMAQQPNVLLSDEPTNYVSLDVLEAFGAAILHFPGSVIAVAHDCWFIQRFGGTIWHLLNRRIEYRCVFRSVILLTIRKHRGLKPLVLTFPCVLLY